MIYSAFNLKETVMLFVLPVVAGIVSLVAGIACVLIAVKLIKRQIKLYNSITLVRLKSAKFHYLIFIVISAILTVFLVVRISDPKASEYSVLYEHFGIDYGLSVLTYAPLLFLLACVEFLLIVMFNSKSAVVDRGVYTVLTYLDWYNVHDYLIDEEKCIVVLTSAKETFNTIRGTTPPLKVAKNDVSKLKFILNKNKNKFSGFNKDTKAF